MRLLPATLALLAVTSIARAEEVPLPQPRPATVNERFAIPPSGTVVPAITSLAPAPELQGLPPMPEASPDPSPCALRLSEIAAFTALPALIGPGECGARDVVQLDVIVMPDKSRVAVNPPAVLRCSMAEAVAHWMREDVGPAVVPFGGAPLAAIANYDSFECRGRNRVVGAKLSEHGKANALDIRALKLANGSTIDPTSPLVAKTLRETLRTSACARFMTVLGPGSDGYHESHIHVDLAERRNNYRLCHWELREPPLLVNVPLPAPRPLAEAND